ncbi:AEC family transporter [Chloroflexota bacterium]
MTDLLTLFANNLLPILLVAGTGYIAGKWLNVEARSISRVVFYLFSPCLLFDLLVNSRLNNSDMLRMVGFTVTTILSVAAITWLLGRMIKLERKMLAAVIICTMTINAGNYGLSLSLFAFGEEALAYSSLFFVTSAIITYTVGVTIASMGKSSLAASLKGLLKIPAVYAVILALIFIYLNLELPLPLSRTVSLLSDAAIPGMLLVLGLQMQNNHRTPNSRALILANGMRLLGGMGIGFLVAAIFGLQGMAYNAGVLESSMPTAVLSTILATEYDAEPAFVTTAVFTSTLLSPLTLTPLLWILGA